MKIWSCLFGASLLALSTHVAARPAGGGAIEHTFKQAPVNALGVTSMADLRGKPVLIDFWGTR